MSAEILHHWIGGDLLQRCGRCGEVLVATIYCRMADDTATSPIDTSEKAVQGRVEGIIDDAVAGRLTPPQRRAVGSAVERADRVSPDSDKSVRRILGG